MHKNEGLRYLSAERADGETPKPVWIAAPFDVLARTSDDAHDNHGLLLRWTDNDRHEHRWAMPKSMVQRRQSHCGGIGTDGPALRHISYSA
jgi:hypothetical protein